MVIFILKLIDSDRLYSFIGEMVLLFRVIVGNIMLLEILNCFDERLLDEFEIVVKFKIKYERLNYVFYVD